MFVRYYGSGEVQSLHVVTRVTVGDRNQDHGGGYENGPRRVSNQNTQSR